MKIYDYSGRANISGDRIHQARTAQRLSQDVLAAKMQVYGVGLGREAISRIETGDVSLPIMSLPSSPAFSVFPSYGSPAIWNRKNNSGAANRL
jgi:hypothetical protein